MSKKILGLSLLGLAVVIILVVISGFVSRTKITIQNTWTVDCDHPYVYDCTGEVGATNNDNLYLINPMLDGSYHRQIFDSLHNGETYTCIVVKDLSQSTVYYIMQCK
jgi:hypothetical protein